MKSISLIIPVLLMTAISAPAAATDSSAALQRGLFEEEANHNLEAAIQAYQAVIAQYDKDRKLTATAVFRLGESYRKQGKTNEAAAQYERVLGEFADQTELATLSRSLLPAAVQTKPIEAGGEAPTTSAEAEEVKRIQAMIKDSPDLINARNFGVNGGGTPLHQAALKGQLIVAKFLLANGADPEARNNSGQTPLHTAAMAGHKAIIELLLEHKANSNAVDGEGYAPLHLAAQRGFKSVVEVLISQGAEVNAKTLSGSTPLHEAAANGYNAVAELLLTRGADPTADARMVRGTIGGTPLHIAADRGDEPMAALLLANKARVNAVTDDGEMPLHRAAMKGQASVTKLLLSKGAEVDAKSRSSQKRDWTPLHYALFDGKREIVALLLANKADPNAKFNMGQNQWEKGVTPLLFAASKGYADVVDMLTSAKADPNLRSDNGWAPIFAAVNCSVVPERKPMTQALLEHGADPDGRDLEKATPLMRAIFNGDQDVVSLLLLHKASVTSTDDQGKTPLHYAVSAMKYRDMTPIAALLIDARAEVNSRDQDGKTPLTWWNPPNSNVPGYKNMADLLRQHGALVDLPRPDAIQVRRPSANFSDTPLIRGTNDWNRFTFLEILAMEYGLLTKVSQGESQEGYDYALWASRNGKLGFPNLERVKLRRPASDLKAWQEQTVDASAPLKSGDCLKCVPIEWGDVIELDEADRPLNERWPGFSGSELAHLRRCLSREVQVNVKGKTTKVTLAPEVSFNGATLEVVSIKTGTPFWIKPALRKTGLLLTSSDLSRIKVTRRDPASGQQREWVLDCSDSKPAPDFWLRDGDVIEVPDKN